MAVEPKKKKRNDKKEYDACTHTYVHMYIHMYKIHIYVMYICMYLGI